MLGLRQHRLHLPGCPLLPGAPACEEASRRVWAQLSGQNPWQSPGETGTQMGVQWRCPSPPMCARLWKARQMAPAPQNRVCPVNLGAGEGVLTAPQPGRDSVGRTVLLGDEDSGPNTAVPRSRSLEAEAGWSGPHQHPVRNVPMAGTSGAPDQAGPLGCRGGGSRHPPSLLSCPPHR